MLDKNTIRSVLLLIVILSTFMLLTSCGKEESIVDVEEVNEMSKGQTEVTEIKDTLSPETNFDDLQQDIKEFDDW